MWRCKQRLTAQDNATSTKAARPHTEPPLISPTKNVSNCENVKCCCGKKCKGIRGLKMHQRSCRIVLDLNNELTADILEQHTDSIDYSTTDELSINDFIANGTSPDLKQGINLPKNDDEWLTANLFFKSDLPPITSDDIGSNIKQLNDVVYNYFQTNYGNVKTNDSAFIDKYKNYSTKDLKKALKILKSSNNNVEEIKYVARTLRDKLQKSQHDPDKTDINIDHDKYISKNFWGYVKNILNKKTSALPTFNMTECASYFRQILSQVNPYKLFVIPSWIPRLKPPDIPYNLDPPTYDQVTNVIRKMKSSGSPCPLDQISIICFKRCPYLRTYLTDIISNVWSSGSVPSEWKKACTILIHKKGETNNPANFRPITLESIPLKVFTSCLRNSIFSFLSKNNLIEHKIQKGFTPGISGTLEHTAQMAHIINKARIKQRSVVITLLDLKNAFGEVHHNLIQSVLSYHHVPDQIQNMVKSLYSDFQTSIITSDFSTPFITVGRGVLQGDCLSPLLFNMCFNTFIQHIKDDRYRQFGFSFSLLNPLHWFQFADDAAVVSSLESENQHLLNRFALWCEWSDMLIRVDKCCTFGIKKIISKSVQYLPKLIINNELIPCVKIGECFKYLGRYFDFQMSNESHKTELTNLIDTLMTDIDNKPLHPKNKLLLYSRYVLSKISWHFTVCDLSKTWVIQNIDNKIAQFIRKWLDIPISGTLSNIFLPCNKFGLNICPPSVKFTQCQTVLRKALKSSSNADIQHLWKSSCQHTNIQYDIFKTTKDVIKSFHKLDSNLLSQGFFYTNIINYSLTKLNGLWSSAQSNLPKNIYNFTVRYINNTLKNLVNWGISQSSECSFCLSPESLLHVVSGCQHYLDRFTWRHNSVLNAIAASLKPINNSTLYADLDDYHSPSIITGDRYRPDLILKTPTTLYILELTVGFESNLKKNADRKNDKYKELISDLKNNYNDVKFINLSISSLGVFSSECISFIEMLENLDFDKKQHNYLIRKIMNIAIRTTYYIFCCRNKVWDDPDLMKY